MFFVLKKVRLNYHIFPLDLKICVSTFYFFIGTWHSISLVIFWSFFLLFLNKSRKSKWRWGQGGGENHKSIAVTITKKTLKKPSVKILPFLFLLFCFFRESDWDLNFTIWYSLILGVNSHIPKLFVTTLALNLPLRCAKILSPFLLLPEPSHKIKPPHFFSS